MDLWGLIGGGGCFCWPQRYPKMKVDEDLYGTVLAWVQPPKSIC